MALILLILFFIHIQLTVFIHSHLISINNVLLVQLSLTNITMKLIFHILQMFYVLMPKVAFLIAQPA
jgi:hypothetical protein